MESVHTTANRGSTEEVIFALGLLVRNLGRCRNERNTDQSGEGLEGSRRLEPDRNLNLPVLSKTWPPAIRHY